LPIVPALAQISQAIQGLPDRPGSGQSSELTPFPPAGLIKFGLTPSKKSQGGTLRGLRARGNRDDPKFMP
jgi:hypothetical protein